MSKKKIAHEAPISMFDYVQDRTSYDYCLVHLYAENEAYRDKFLQAKKKGREIILDTSVFELGTAFDENYYLQVIEELQPEWYILPDVLENAPETVASAKHWMKFFAPNFTQSKPIGVVQGKTYSELVGCYMELAYELNIPKIAISFDYSYYLDSFPHPNKLVSWMFGRAKLLGDLLQSGIIDVNRPHHLLGNSMPQEGRYYGQYNWIDSVDTSNPVLHAIKGIEYEPNFGLYDKNSQKLHELINYEETDTEIRVVRERILEHNIKEFYKYWQTHAI